MEGFGETLKSAVGNMDTVLMDIRVVLEQNDNKVEQAISKIDTIITDLGKSLKPLEATMKNLEVFSDSLKDTEFKATVASTNQLLKNINYTLDSLKNENGTIGRLMTDDSLYNSLNKVLVDLDKLLIHFRNHPRDFMAPLGRKNKKLEGLKED
jgi:phospholipid/cholesterol/gamma-HCH transport system substrate-binding protein